MKKKILVINPVATSEWNESDAEYLRKAAASDTSVELVNIERGPATIESFYDEDFAIPDILRLVKENKDSFDGIMINCFADPGISAAREICDIPVAGPGESAMALALLLGHKFSIISVKKNVVSMFEIKARAMGLTKKLASIEYIDIPVSELEKDKEKTVGKVVSAIERAVAENHAEVVILGCTGMLSLYMEVAKRVNVPVIEPAITALKTLEMLIDLRLTHSKVGLYTYPVFDKIKGY